MSRIIVLIIGIVWASLLLVSWGGAETPRTTSDLTAQEQKAS